MYNRADTLRLRSQSSFALKGTLVLLELGLRLDTKNTTAPLARVGVEHGAVVLLKTLQELGEGVLVLRSHVPYTPHNTAGMQRPTS